MIYKFLVTYLVSILHTNSSIPGVYWQIQSNRRVHLELCHKNPDTPEKARYIAKSDCVIQLNHREVWIHASCETARTWEIFEHQGTKLFLLSDEL